MTLLLKLVMADDHPIIRDGIKAHLALEEDILCIGEAEDGAGLLALLDDVTPDLLVLDLNMPGLWGEPFAYIQALHQRHPALKTLVLTAYPDVELAVGAMRAGVTGYLLKNTVSDLLVTAIRQVARGELWLDPSIAQGVVQRVVEATHQQPAMMSMSERERMVLLRLVQHATIEQIAAELGIADSTVRSYLRRIYRKLGVHSRAEAIQYALRYLAVAPGTLDPRDVAKFEEPR